VGGWAILALVISDLAKWVPEWRTFATARKKGLPVLAQTAAGSGETDWSLGEKDENGDPVFTMNGFGVQVDPKFSAGILVPDRHVRGLKIYHFCTDRPLPIDYRNALAIQSVVSTVRENFPQLDFLTNDQVNALLNTPRSDLDKYCETFYKMLAPSLSESKLGSAEDLASVIKSAQNLLSTQPALPPLASSTPSVSGGWFSYAYAFKNITTAYLSQDMHQYSLLIERKIRKQTDDFNRRSALLFMGAIAICGIIVSGAVAYSIIS
ncbi:MAG: hypothetical protein WC343_04550, partial [Bacilli bacterium]|jgi:hypothetical protein